MVIQMDSKMDGRKMRHIILIFCLVVALPTFLFGRTIYKVELSRKILSDTSSYHGSKTLEFAKPAAGTVTVPPQWTNVETGIIVDNPSLQPTYCVRYSDDRGVVRYAVTGDGGNVFDSTSVLSFHTNGDRQIADFTIIVRPKEKADTTLKRFAGKIFLYKNRVLARLAECREGTLQIGNQEYDICIYAPSVNNPFYDLSTNAVSLIDMNHDGTYSWRWQTNDSIGTVIPSERIVLPKPFSVDGHKLKAMSIDSAGTTFTCSDYNGDTAEVVGFMAPGFSVVDLSGNTYSLADMKEHLVLITFWAPGCGYCEKIRPRLDTLVSHCDPAQFQAISATVDTDKFEIEEFLQNRPYGGIVTLYNEPLWKMYNPRKTTPVYYIIDRDGSVLFSGSGASMFSIVERIISDMLPLEKEN